MKDEMVISNSKTLEKDGLIKKDIIQVLSIIKSHRDKAYRKANEEQIMAYYELGKFLSNKIKEAEWGSKAIERLAEEINLAFPESKSISKRGLYRMIQFYETYAGNKIVSPLVSQIRNRAGILGYSIAE